MPGPLYRDPWAAREAWRTQGVFDPKYMRRNMFPGLGIATVAFVAYVIYDDYLKPKVKHHAPAEQH
ncbi:NADH dehydrogenase 1 beta subcomplex subunit 3 [Kockovaella imperatae]|uniref:NADH dehydrogenase 1 beta subcomplex subunit 3 n=1 Tax=Kockovaella imperatae TaxID=4999 RepID=A0A1Y1USC1_9TREE|nr:NADH dehydrogenase 1 beta subcomplex subunit 3 [Kockovaella imperatae]ORX40527.1 NADH dehydrogenase 1 beta subcomplex subunit 3 [Kockovaella imperatae]